MNEKVPVYFSTLLINLRHICHWTVSGLQPSHHDVMKTVYSRLMTGVQGSGHLSNDLSFVRWRCTTSQPPTGLQQGLRITRPSFLRRTFFARK